MRRCIFSERHLSLELYHYDLSLCRFDVWSTHFSEPNVHIPNTLMVPWVRVAPSHIHDSGYGLFALKTFTKGQIISVYVGQKVPEGDMCSEYAMSVGNQVIDPVPVGSKAMLFWGAHLANDVFYGQDKGKIGRHGIDNNAYFEGIYLKSKGTIKPDIEILVDYNLTGNDKSCESDSVGEIAEV